MTCQEKFGADRIFDWAITEEVRCTGPAAGLDLEVLLQGYEQQFNLPPSLLTPDRHLT